MSEHSMNYPRESSKGAGTMEPAADRVRATVEKTKQTLGEAKEQTTRAVQRGYNQTLEYARQHPQQLSLIMLGSGIVIGMMVASRMSHRRRDYRTVARPLVEALSDVGRMLTR